KKIFSYKADKLIACSNSIKQHMINNFNLDENRIEVIYNAVDLALTKPVAKKEQLKKDIGIGSEEFVIGFVGRIDFEEKGVDILLDVFKSLSKQYLKIHLLLIGEGSNYNEVERYCVINKSKATLLSSKENIFDYCNLMDLIVLPSRVDPFPLTMIETGLMNLPLIGSNVDGIAEFIEHGVNGLLFESGNTDELKLQIVKIIENKKFGATLADNLYSKVLTSFTVQKIVPQYEKLYKDILNDTN
ncbi:MAG: glycosyltransferase family 4 protein, partial [Ignavibacteria bacterium]|nr:glycosyltransferase family 4 protein [Ignavibacteria bacterium]